MTSRIISKVVFVLAILFSLMPKEIKAQNDSIVFFLFDDGNNNFIYEPGIGEKPLINYCLSFQYQYNISATGYYNGKTDNNGYFKVKNLNNLVIPASNMLSKANAFPSDAKYNNVLFGNHTNFAYNTVHNIPLYSVFGFKKVNPGSLTISGGPGYSGGYNLFCIGKSTLYLSSGMYCRNLLDYVASPQPVSYTVTNGTTSNVYTTTLTINWPNPPSGCNWGWAMPLPAIPELSTVGTYTFYYSATNNSNIGINDGIPWNQAMAVLVDSCSTVTGNLTFVDCNANCYKDGAEIYSSDEVITSTNGTYSTMAIPDYNGNYNVLSPYSPTQYTLTVVPNSGLAMTCSVSPNSYYYSSAATNVTRYDKLTQTSVNNLNCYVYQNNPHSGSSVPGGNFKIDAYYGILHPAYCASSNNAGTFYIKLDPSVQLTSLAAGTPTYSALFPSATGDSIVWNFSDLRANAMNLTGKIFSLNLFMKTTAVINTNYCIKSGVISLYTETTLADNVFNKCWVIGGPFDPNEKNVEPKGFGTQGIVPPATNELTYHINFQNVGTAPAINVRIKDQLNNNIDWNSLQVLGSSAPVQTNVSGSGLVNFLFDNILLPDSTHNEPGSHGFVTYKVNLKPGLPIGTVINNYASIYFDYNAPVITNTTVTTLSTTVLGLNEISQNSISVYPNPTKGNVIVTNPELNIQKIKVLNVVGQVVFEEIGIKTEKYIIDISNQAKGIYFVEITGKADETIVKKLILE